MGKIFARLVLWLIRPAINALSKLRPAAEFIEAAMISRGDVLVLKSVRPLTKEQRECATKLIEKSVNRLGVKVLILEPPLEIAGLINFHDKRGNDQTGLDT